MNYTAAFSDFFKSPNWVKNLLFGGLCVLSTGVIPIVGAMVLVGWHVTGFWMRKDEKFENFPDFDFKYFSEYLQRGLWPFLVTMVAGMAVGLVMWILIMIPMVLVGLLAGSGDETSGIVGAIIGLFSMGLYLVLFITVSMVLVPLGLRATLTQDFGAAFNMAFLKRFFSLMWKELLLCSLFMLVASLALMVVGMIALCVGMFFTMSLVYFAWAHLAQQLYHLYLSRGGEPIPMSPKLTGEVPMPPSIPNA